MTTDANTTQPPAPANKKRRRRWPWVILFILLILILGVILTPTLLSTPPGRSFLVARVNDRIPGKLEVGGLSVGWFSATRVEGLKLSDPSGKLVLDLPSLDTQLTLLDALCGKYHLGKSAIDVNLLDVERDATGVTNLQRALSEQPAPAATQTASTPKPVATQPAAESREEKTANKPIDASGDITLTIKNAHWKDPQASVDAAPTKAHVVFDTAGLPANISLETHVQAAGSAPASVTLNGTADLFHRQRIRPVHEMKLQGNAVVAQLDLGSLKGLLSSLGVTTLADGQLNANVNFDATQTTTVARGDVHVRNFILSGPSIKGDKLALNQVDLPLDVQLQSEGLKIRKLDLVIAPTEQDLASKPDLALRIARNSMLNWSGENNNATLNLEYDLARLTAIFKAYMPVDTTAEGRYTSQMKITGALSQDAGLQKLRELQMESTKIGFDHIKTGGFDLGKSEIALALAKGILTLGPSRVPANGGELNLAGMVNLNKSPAVFELNQALDLAKGVQMNKQIAAGPLAFLPIAWGLDESKMQLLDAKGAINVRLDRASLPLTFAELQKRGTAAGVLSIDGFTSNSPMFNEVLTALGPIAKITQTNWSMQEQRIDNVAFSLANGRVNYKNFVMKAGTTSLTFAGQAGLDKSLDMNLQVTENRINLDVPVTIRGTMSKPKINVSAQAVEKTIQQSAPAIIEGLINRNKKEKDKQPSTQPAQTQQQKKNEPVRNLIENLLDR